MVYDVTGDQVRYRLSRRLRRCGYRIGYSVFVIMAGDGELAALTSECAGIIDGSGVLLALPYCEDCDLAAIGAPLEAEPRDGWVTG